MPSTMDDKELRDRFDKASKEMLSFYGVQLQSHASIIIGLAVLVFALLQAWGPLSAGASSTKYLSLMFSAFMGLIGAAFVHQLLRIYVFGKLASALLYASYSVYDKCMKNFENRFGESYVKETTDFGKVNLFTNWMFQSNTKPLIALNVFMVTKGKDGNTGVRRSFWVLALAFEISFGLFYAVIFGGFDWWFLAWFLPVSFLFIEVAHYVIIRRVLPWLSKKGSKQITQA